MIQTADNMPPKAVAPSELDLLAQLVGAAVRCAAALEVIAEDARRQMLATETWAQAASEPPLSARDVLSAGAAKLMETPHVCEDRDARLSDDGAWLVCSVCSKRTRYAKLEAEKTKNEDARGASSGRTEAATPAGTAATGTVASTMSPAAADGLSTVAASPSHAAGSSEPQAPAGDSATPAGAPSQDAPKPERSIEALIESGETLTGRDADGVRAAITAEAEKAASHGAELDAAMRERDRIARGLPGPLAAKVAAMGDDEVADKDVALEIKHYASGLLTPDGFAKARTALGVKPKALPTGLQLKRLAVEVLAAELDAREKTTAAPKGSGSPW